MNCLVYPAVVSKISGSNPTLYAFASVFLRELVVMDPRFVLPQPKPSLVVIPRTRKSFSDF